MPCQACIAADFFFSSDMHCFLKKLFDNFARAVEQRSAQLYELDTNSLIAD